MEKPDYAPITKPKKWTKRKPSVKADREQYHIATERARDPEGFLRCERCGHSILDGQEFRHHIKLRSQGGSTTAENISVICLPCHNAAHGIRMGGGKG